MYNIRKKTNHPVFVCLFVYKLVNTSVNILFKKTSFEDQKAVWKESFLYKEQLTSDMKVAIKVVK